MSVYITMDAGNKIMVCCALRCRPECASEVQWAYGHGTPKLEKRDTIYSGVYKYVSHREKHSYSWYGGTLFCEDQWNLYSGTCCVLCCVM